MGKNSEIHIEMNANLSEDEALRLGIIEQFKTKKMRLSCSTLKQFTSPINLINYKMKPYIANAGMVFGSVCDLLLLTPDKFDSEFAIVSDAPTTNKQKDFCNELIEFIKNKRKNYKLKGEDIELIYNNYYSRGCSAMLYESLKIHIDSKVLGIQTISQELYNEANELIENLKQKSEVADLLSQIQSVQTELKWSENGWKFLGYLDMLLDNHIVDAKYSKDADPDKFIRDIQNLDYFLQGAIYCRAVTLMGICDNPKFSFLVYDKSGNFSIIELGYSYIKYGERKYFYLLEQLERCIKTNSFDKSYNFFKKELIAVKPGWAKGYALKTDLGDE